MTISKSRIWLAFTTASALLIYGCGGGGGGSAGNTSSTTQVTLPTNMLTGTAAVGAPIVGGTVSVICSSGSSLGSVVTSSIGGWSVPLNGQTFPCAVKVSGGSINGIANTTPYTSIAIGAGTVNVTPLTDLVVSNLINVSSTNAWFSGLTSSLVPLASINSSQVNTALSNLRTYLSGLTPLSATNPITTSFTPIPGNTIDDMLTALKAAMTSSNVSYVSLLNNFANHLAPPSGFNSNLVIAYAGISTPSLASNYLTIKWQDDFSLDSAGTPNPSYWAMLTGDGTEYGIPGWGAGQAQYYLPGNANVSNGVLNIHGYHDSTVSGHTCFHVTCAFSSGLVTSTNTVDLSKPGYLEIKATIPTAEGSWPALWLLPGNSPGSSFPPTQGTQNSTPQWPTGGEIDMVEYMWQFMSSSTSEIQSTLHMPIPTTGGLYVNGTYNVNNAYSIKYPTSVATTFHLYQLLWTNATIQFAIDNIITMTCTKATLTCSQAGSGTVSGFPAGTIWPFGTVATQYYLTMNLAIGALGITNSNNALVPTNYDQTMQVSSVRYLTP
jgi:beta-glucanase (GH16 family)